jgi:predicted transcriptional regulator
VIQKLEEFSKKTECTRSLQHLWVVMYEYEKQLTCQNKIAQTKIDNFLSVPEMCNACM